MLNNHKRDSSSNQLLKKLCPPAMTCPTDRWVGIDAVTIIRFARPYHSHDNPLPLPVLQLQQDTWPSVRFAWKLYSWLESPNMFTTSVSNLSTQSKSVPRPHPLMSRVVSTINDCRPNKLLNWHQRRARHHHMIVTNDWHSKVENTSKTNDSMNKVAVDTMGMHGFWQSWRCLAVKQAFDSICIKLATCKPSLHGEAILTIQLNQKLYVPIEQSLQFVCIHNSWNVIRVH